MYIIIIILHFAYKLTFLFLSDNFFFCCNFPVLDFFGEEENP